MLFFSFLNTYTFVLGYPSNSFFIPVWSQVTDPLYSFQNYIFKTLVISFGWTLYMVYCLQQSSNIIKYLPKSTQYLYIQICLLLFPQYKLSTPKILFTFLSIICISFTQTQHAKVIRMSCTIATLEGWSSQFFPLVYPSQLLLLSYHSANALFWHYVFMKSPLTDQNIFLPPLISPCTSFMGFIEYIIDNVELGVWAYSP